ncbi:uncharacterized protein LOC120246756 [Hyaena hyaena]|uniref:uncharacterized protein LOC120246756 n=1 Tax=Hyaena hyaena TaxID=95912 RepID=UPI001922767C|nr:uncharacterized protein LOC120246756 [Hyaena hyaena]
MEPGTGTSTSAVAGGGHSWSACTSGGPAPPGAAPRPRTPRVLPLERVHAWGARTSGSGPASPDPACAPRGHREGSRLRQNSTCQKTSVLRIGVKRSFRSRTCSGHSRRGLAGLRPGVPGFAGVRGRPTARVQASVGVVRWGSFGIVHSVCSPFGSSVYPRNCSQTVSVSGRVSDPFPASGSLRPGAESRLGPHHVPERRRCMRLNKAEKGMKADLREEASQMR